MFYLQRSKADSRVLTCGLTCVSGCDGGRCQVLEDFSEGYVSPFNPALEGL